MSHDQSQLEEQHGPVHDFKEGIKRDMSLFLALNYVKQWVTWKLKTLAAQAEAQNVSEALCTHCCTTKEQSKEGKEFALEEEIMSYFT